MNYLFILLSITSMVLQNSLQNVTSRKFLKNPGDTYCFNAFIMGVCLALSLILLITGGKISLFTAMVGGLYGISLLLCSAAKMNAMTCGPMHLTILISASSMIIPAMSGALFFGEPFSLFKLFAVFLLIGFVYLSLDVKKGAEKRISKKWLLFSFLGFVFQGLLGVFQKLHQSTDYKTETTGFFLASFAFAFLFTALMSSKNKKSERYDGGFYIMGIVCGITMFVMNYVNLILSGLFPSQMLFPVVNGSELIFTTIISIVVFKDKTSVKQIIGLAGGLASLILICFV